MDRQFEYNDDPPYSAAGAHLPDEFPEALIRDCHSYQGLIYNGDGSIFTDEYGQSFFDIIVPYRDGLRLRSSRGDSDDDDEEMDIVHRELVDYAYILMNELRKVVYGGIYRGTLLTKMPTADGSVKWIRTQTKVAIKKLRCHPLMSNIGDSAERPMEEIKAIQYLQRHIARRNGIGMEDEEFTSENIRSLVERGMVENNVMTPVETLTDGLYFYLAMPFCDGKDLLDVIQERKFSETKARHFFKQILNALVTLQEAGMCHRDLSLENVITCGNELAIVVTDFGLCLKIPYTTDGIGISRRSLIRPDIPCGKPYYMSPEVAESRPFDGHAIDIWALGPILFIMTCGFAPWDQPTINDQRFQLFTSGHCAQLVRHWNLGLSDDLTDLLQRMFMLDPGSRLSLKQVRDHPWMAGPEILVPQSGLERTSLDSVDSLGFPNPISWSALAFGLSQATKRLNEVSSQPFVGTQNRPDLEKFELEVDKLSLTVEGAAVQIQHSMGNKEKITISLRIDALREILADKMTEAVSLRESSFSSPVPNTPLLRHIDIDNENRKRGTAPQVHAAKGDKIPLLAKLGNNCMFQWDVFAITDEGIAGTEYESWDVTRGDFMFTFELSEWPWHWKRKAGDIYEHADSFLDLTLEVDTFGGAIQKVDSVDFAYNIGDHSSLLLTNRYFEFGKDHGCRERFMPEGFPEITKGSNDGKYLFTFRFHRFETTKLFYDPIISFSPLSHLWDTRSGKFEVKGTRSQSYPVKFGRGTNISVTSNFVKALEKARSTVFRCHEEDLNDLIYMVQSDRFKHEERYVRKEVGDWLRVKQILDDVRHPWENGETLKVTFHTFDATVDSKKRSTADPDVSLWDIFISARFLGDSTEKRARELCRELLKLDLKVFMVDAKAGDDFGEKVMAGLNQMKTLLAFCSNNYGANTGNAYSTYREIKFANENKKHILPIKICKEWPPAPNDDKGRMQNKFIFGPGMLYLDWSCKEWDATECAREVKNTFDERHSVPL